MPAQPFRERTQLRSAHKSRVREDADEMRTRSRIFWPEEIFPEACMLIFGDERRVVACAAFDTICAGEFEDYEANTFIQRSTVRSTTSSRVERCSTCLAVETRCQCPGALLELSLNNSVSSFVNAECVEAHFRIRSTNGRRSSTTPFS